MILSKKTFAALLLCFIINIAHSQTFDHYYDASVSQDPSMGFGYSYNITFNLTKVSETGYSIQVTNVKPDAKGFLYNTKYYTTTQLGGGCDPLNYGEILISITYSYTNNNGLESKASQNFSFNNTSQSKTAVVPATAKNFGVRYAVVRAKSTDPCLIQVKKLLNPAQKPAGTTKS